jgi:hypothetical protein
MVVVVVAAAEMEVVEIFKVVEVAHSPALTPGVAAMDTEVIVADFGPMVEAVTATGEIVVAVASVAIEVGAGPAL